MKHTAIQLGLATSLGLSIALGLLLVEERKAHRCDMEKALDLTQSVADRARIAEDTLSVVFGKEWSPDRLRVTEVKRAACYTSEEAQTDKSPYMTSIGQRVREGGVALTADLGIPYGARVLVVDTGQLFERNDHMPGASGMDVWTPSLSACKDQMRKFNGQGQTLVWLAEE